MVELTELDKQKQNLAFIQHLHDLGGLKQGAQTIIVLRSFEESSGNRVLELVGVCDATMLQINMAFSDEDGDVVGSKKTNLMRSASQKPQHYIG